MKLISSVKHKEDDSVKTNYIKMCFFTYLAGRKTPTYLLTFLAYLGLGCVKHTDTITVGARPNSSFIVLKVSST